MTILLQKQLDYVSTQRIQQFRPAKFRRIVPVDGSIPTWADRVQHTEIRVNGEADLKLIAPTGPVGELPRSTLSRADAFISILHFGYSYGYSIFDLERAAQTNIDLPATEAVTNQGIAERFLDRVAAGSFLASLGLPGILNVTNTAVTVDQAAVATACLMTACAKAGGGTTWVGATYEEIARDVEMALQRIYANTLELYTGNLVAMSPSRMFYLRTTRHPITQQSVLAQLQAEYPEVRFEAWQALATADAAGTGNRLLAMAQAPSVARMIIPQELKDDAPVQQPLAVLIPQWLSTSGVLVETPSAIVYVDGI